MKQNPRGPYDGVAWYCNDGTVLPPKSYACQQHGGGVQHGVLGQAAKKLAQRGLYVGTILAPLEAKDFVDDDFYRVRALILERYLERVLDGWVLQRAKTYRGFRQTRRRTGRRRSYFGGAVSETRNVWFASATRFAVAAHNPLRRGRWTGG